MSDPFPNPGKIQSAFRKTKCILNKAFLSFQLQKAKLGPRACFQIIILKMFYPNAFGKTGFVQLLWMFSVIK